MVDYASGSTNVDALVEASEVSSCPRLQGEGSERRSLWGSAARPGIIRPHHRELFHAHGFAVDSKENLFIGKVNDGQRDSGTHSRGWSRSRRLSEASGLPATRSGGVVSTNA